MCLSLLLEDDWTHPAFQSTCITLPSKDDHEPLPASAAQPWWNIQSLFSSEIKGDLSKVNLVQLESRRIWCWQQQIPSTSTSVCKTVKYLLSLLCPAPSFMLAIKQSWALEKKNLLISWWVSIVPENEQGCKGNKEKWENSQNQSFRSWYCCVVARLPPSIWPRNTLHSVGTPALHRLQGNHDNGTCVLP